VEGLLGAAVDTANAASRKDPYPGGVRDPQRSSNGRSSPLAFLHDRCEIVEAYLCDTMVAIAPAEDIQFIIIQADDRRTSHDSDCRGFSAPLPNRLFARSIRFEVERRRQAVGDHR